jgi:FkbM family methyltransferase
VQAALWSKEAALHLQAAGKRDAISVSDGAGLFACRGVSVNMLIQAHDVAAIDILKCDIKGAEMEVFSDGCDEWLSRTRCVVVETHGANCLQLVTAAARR